MTQYKIIEHFEVIKSSLISYSLLGDYYNFPLYYDIKEDSFIPSKYFSKTINVFDDVLIKNIYIFFDFNDAAIFYEMKNKRFFENSLLIITSRGSIPLVIEALKKKFLLNFKLEFFKTKENSIYPFYFLFEWINDRLDFFEFSNKKNTLFFKIKGEGIINSIPYDEINFKYFFENHHKIFYKTPYKISSI